MEKRTRYNIRQAQLYTSFQPDSITQEDPSEETSNHSEESLDTPPLSQVSTPVSISDPIPDIPPSPNHRPSGRSNKGTHKSMRCINELCLASVTEITPSSTVANLVYQAELESDFDSG